MIIKEGQSVGGHVGDEFSPSLCLVFFFFTMVSNGVDTMRFPCNALNVQVVRNSNQARTDDKRNHDSLKVANCLQSCLVLSRLFSFIFLSLSLSSLCLSSFSVSVLHVLVWCAVLCYCVLWVCVVYVWRKHTPRIFSQEIWSATALSSFANDWRTRERVVLDLVSNFKCVRYKGFSRAWHHNKPKKRVLPWR